MYFTKTLIKTFAKLSYLISKAWGDRMGFWNFLLSVRQQKQLAVGISSPKGMLRHKESQKVSRHRRVIPIFLVISIILAGCRSNSERLKDNNNNDISSNIELSSGWARPAAKGQNSAAYLTILNHTEHNDTLETIETDASNAAQIHESYEKEGVSGMRRVDRRIIKASSSLVLEPGGFHIMVMGLKKELTTQDSLKLSFGFSQSGIKKITIPILIQK